MPFLDREVKEQVRERAGDRCECEEPEHGHPERCENPLDDHCQYVYDAEMPLRLKVLCYSCYRRRKFLRKKKY